MRRRALLGAVGAVALSAGPAAATTVVLYDQDFENPTGFTNNGADFDQSAVNLLYGNQPPGFTFANSFTVETILLTGSLAFGTGYTDASGQGGNYALGMLSSRQDDRLGLTFDVGSAAFFNLGIDISSIDLSAAGGPFNPPGGSVPTFRLTLFDNPGGAATTNGDGTVLSTADITGNASARDVLDWSSFVVPLSTAGNTNGTVTLQIDLLTGNYAAFDNLRITASDTAGDLGEVPLPAGAWLFLSGLALGWRRLSARA